MRLTDMKTTGVEGLPERPQGLLRRLYSWVLSWADHQYGTWALFLISMAESSFFPIPPDVLQIALSVAKPKRAFFYATVSAIASVLGGILGWMIGYALWEVCGPYFLKFVPGLSQEAVDHVGRLYQQNAFWAIFAAAFTPIPYKVFTLAGGIFQVPLPVLISASLLGRSARFFLVATAIYFFGPSVRKLLEERLELITLALFVLIVIGFVVVKYCLH